ncbi:hypothetical protein [Kalamiella sp. sgz302252]|uniref:hypothetical protein n=1 Tax=Pantoea sp. sgz302252 TaxID=3341827 RepID=UPI0036D4112A
MSDPIQRAPVRQQMTVQNSRGDIESGPLPDANPARAARVSHNAGQFFSGMADGAKSGLKSASGGLQTLGNTTWNGLKTGGSYAGDKLNVAGKAGWQGTKYVGNKSWQGAKVVGKAGWDETKHSAVTLGKFASAPLQNKAWGALGGHALQQMITCGLPTLMREEAFIEAYNMMLPHLAEKHPAAAVGLQVAASLVNIAAHSRVREPRLARDPLQNDVAVRGQFGLSPSQGAVMKRDKPQEWQSLVDQHQSDSKRVSGQQVMAELLNVGMSAAGALTGNSGLTARVLSTQLRNVLYAVSRESLQATGSMVASRDGKASHGVSDGDMSTNGAWYTLNTLAMGMLQDALIQKALPQGYTVSGPEIRDASGQRLSGKELHQMGALVSGIRAACNTVIETGDAFLGKHYDAKRAGDSQKFSPSLPMKDYGRLLDHSIARLSWNNFANGSTLAAQQVLNAATKGNISPLLSSLLNNAGTAAAFGLTYKMVNQIYQAHSKVRGAVAAATNGPANITAAGQPNPAAAIQGQQAITAPPAPAQQAATTQSQQPSGSQQATNNAGGASG